MADPVWLLCGRQCVAPGHQLQFINPVQLIYRLGKFPNAVALLRINDEGQPTPATTILDIKEEMTCGLRDLGWLKAPGGHGDNLRWQDLLRAICDPSALDSLARRSQAQH